ncbi:MAG: hypothetical protein V1659_04490 [Candidatus Woesearchaeota archaeon]
MAEQTQPKDDKNTGLNAGMLFPEAQTAAPVKKSSKEAEPYESLIKSASNIDLRLKILEDRYSSLRKKTQVSDQNMIETEHDVWNEIKTINDDLIELKKRINSIVHQISQMNEELKNTASKYDLKIIEKYLDMWQPMNFVTREELEREG